MSLYSAFNTLQLELERLLNLRESITVSGQALKHKQKLAELNQKIYSHEQAVALLNRVHQTEAKLIARSAEQYKTH